MQMADEVRARADRDTSADHSVANLPTISWFIQHGDLSRGLLSLTNHRLNLRKLRLILNREAEVESR